MRTEAEVERAFDRFHMYTKGCVIIEMTKNLVSDGEFRLSVQRFIVILSANVNQFKTIYLTITDVDYLRYLKNNAFKAVGREALWKALPKHVTFGTEQEILENVIEPWLINNGMPEVTIR